MNAESLIAGNGASAPPAARAKPSSPRPDTKTGYRHVNGSIGAILGVGILERLLPQVPSPDSETSLVERAVQRDSAAFTALYELHIDRVLRHVWYQVPDRTDAEDITQDVFVKAWKSIHRYRWTGAPFAAWLFTIARNAVNDYYRSKKNTRSLDDIEEPRSDDSPAAKAESVFAGEEVRRAVTRLKGDQQAVIIMRFVDGLSYEEISRATGKAEGAVRVIQHRALKELKKIMDKESLW